MGTEIEIHHAVHEPIAKKVSGSVLRDADIKDLVWSATSVLERRNGYFFDTIGDVFVFGFLSEWSIEEGAPRADEFYYDIFSVDAEAVSNLDFNSLVESLDAIAVSSLQEEYETVRKLTVSEIEDRNESDTSQIIAKIASQLQTNEKAIATLDELSIFFSEVEGALENVSFISAERSEGEYFNVVGGRHTSRPEPGLVDLIKQKENEEIHIDDLLSLNEGEKFATEQVRPKPSDQGSDKENEGQTRPVSAGRDTATSIVAENANSLISSRNIIMLTLILLIELILLSLVLLLIYLLHREEVIDFTNILHVWMSII